MSNLPYLASPGNIPKVLDAIKRAPTPPKVSQDFVKTKLLIPGSSGDQMASFLKRIGFASSDGSPTEIYKDFRSQSGGRAMAQAVRTAYAPLYAFNEYMHDLPEKEIKDLIIKESGLALDARPVSLIYSTLRHLLDVAEFTGENEKDKVKAQDLLPNNSAFQGEFPRAPNKEAGAVGLNIGYTINLNLPESTNIEVFNAIFKSLREHLLKSEDV